MKKILKKVSELKDKEEYDFVRGKVWVVSSNLFFCLAISGHLIAELFEDLPDAKLYPDYYHLVCLLFSKLDTKLVIDRSLTDQNASRAQFNHEKIGQGSVCLR